MPAYRRKAGAWVQLGVGTPPPEEPVDPGTGSTDPAVTRAGLVYGNYMPGPTTTGHVRQANWQTIGNTSTATFTAVAGQSYTNSTIYGDIVLPTNGPVEFRNCELLGGSSIPTGDTGVVRATGAVRGGYADFYDCTIRPHNPRNGRNAMLGRQYRAYRCNVSYTTDGFGIYSQLTSGNPDADVEIHGCWTHDLLYRYPDPATNSHTDGAHTDGIQWQGGNKVWIRGNFLENTGVMEADSQPNPAKPWMISAQYGTNWANGACIIIQKQTTTYAVDSAASNIVESNWTKGGLGHYNLKSTLQAVTIRSNRVFRDTAIRPSGATGEAHGGYWVRGDSPLPKSTITGLYTQRWVDGPYAGQLLSDGGTNPGNRDLGIVFDG